MLVVLWGIAWISAFVLVGAFDTPWWQPAMLWFCFQGAIVAQVGQPGGGRAELVPWTDIRGHAIGAVAIVLALFGGMRADGYLSRPLPTLAEFVGEAVTATGVVDAEPRRGLTTQRFRVDVRSLETGDRTADVDGRLLATFGEYEDLAPGTLVRLTGQLSEPPVLGEFDYPKYLLKQDIVGTMYMPRIEVLGPPHPLGPAVMLAGVRDKLDLGLARSLPEPEASLASGLLIGRDDGLPDDVEEAFRTTGLAHIVAVSGSNVVIVTAIVFATASPLLGRRRALFPAVAAVVFYVLLAGADWSIVRAAAMACVYLLGEHLGRPRSGLGALAVVVVGITAVRPDAAFDVGFQLSSSATGGLIAFGPWLRFLMLSALGTKGRAIVPLAVVEVEALTLSATVATLPISWATFGRLSLVSPMANLIAEPLFAIAFMAVGATATVALLSEPLGWGIGLAAFHPLHYMVLTAEILAQLPFAAKDTGHVAHEVAALSGGLFALAAWPCYRFLPPDLPATVQTRGTRVIKRASLAVIGCGLGGALLTNTLMPLRGPGELKLVILDVGQGDAILAITPNGRTVLMDGGPSGLGLTQELGRALPHWQRQLDIVLVSHPQQDHFAGLIQLLETYDVRQILESSARSDSRTYALFDRSASPLRSSVSAGTAFEVDGVSFELLWPPANWEAEDVNESSLVVRVSYAGSTVLLTGDIEGDAIGALATQSDVHADLLKVPHHGSSTTPSWFFDRVRARAAVISVGEDNRFGHPTDETLDALSGSTVARTDLDGRVTVTVGPEGITISSERGETVSLPVGTAHAYGERRQEAGE